MESRLGAFQTQKSLLFTGSGNDSAFASKRKHPMIVQRSTNNFIDFCNLFTLVNSSGLICLEQAEVYVHVTLVRMLLL